MRTDKKLYRDTGPRPVRGVGHLGVGLSRAQRRQAAREDLFESSLALGTALDVACQRGVRTVSARRSAPRQHRGDAFEIAETEEQLATVVRVDEVEFVPFEQQLAAVRPE